MLKTIPGYLCGLALLWAAACGRNAEAAVDVTIDGNTAYAQISLTDGNGQTYDADVTITFQTVQNLSVASLNLTAQLVNPNDPILGALLPLGTAVDPAFPMMITVEPPNFSWLFVSGFDANETGSGNLSFTNTYEFEVHTHNLVYTDNSPYRLIKAPIGGAFHDFTEDVFPGSVRARGREGAFSQFLVVKDSATTLIPMLLVATTKLLALQARVLVASIGDLLRLDLLGLLADITTDLVLILLDLTDAILHLDQFIALVTAHAGVDIANVWDSQHDVTNDAGEILGLAQTLRFTLVQLQNL